MPAQKPNLIRRIAQVWAAVRRAWPALILWTAGGAAAGLAVCAVTPPQWQATATLLIPETKTPALGTPIWSPSGTTGAAASVQGVLFSEAVLTGVARRTGLSEEILRRSLRIVSRDSTRQIEISAVLPDRRQALAVVQIAVERARRIPRELNSNAALVQRQRLRREVDRIASRAGDTDRRLVRYQMNMTSPPVEEVENPPQMASLERLASLSAAAAPSAALPGLSATPSYQEAVSALLSGAAGQATAAQALAAPLGPMPANVAAALAAAQATGMVLGETPAVPVSIHARRIRRLLQQLAETQQRLESARRAAQAQSLVADIVPGQAAIVGVGVTLGALQYALRVTETTAGPLEPALLQQRSAYAIAHSALMNEASRSAQAARAGLAPETTPLEQRIAVLRWRIERERALARAEIAEADAYQRIRNEQHAVTTELATAEMARLTADIQSRVDRVRFSVLDPPYLRNDGEPVNRNPLADAFAGALACLAMGTHLACRSARRSPAPA